MDTHEHDDDLMKDCRGSLHVRLIAVGTAGRLLPGSALPHTIAVIGEQIDPCRTAPPLPASRTPQIIARNLLIVNNNLS